MNQKLFKPATISSGHIASASKGGGGLPLRDDDKIPSLMSMFRMQMRIPLKSSVDCLAFSQATFSVGLCSSWRLDHRAEGREWRDSMVGDAVGISRLIDCGGHHQLVKTQLQCGHENGESR